MSPNPNYKAIEELHADHKMRSQVVRNYNANKHSVADRALRRPHHYFEKRVWACISMQKTGLILDFGCGNGMRTRKFVQDGWQLCGIDISEESIKIARKDSQNQGLQAEYYIMDGENMTFPDNQFDLIVDYGAFSSVDMKKGVPDLLRGIRTKWSAKHIMKLSDWAKLKNNFRICKTKFFGVTTTLIAPFIWCVPQRLQNYLITCCEKIDNLLLKSDMVKPWAFKTVVQLSKPI